MTFTACRYCGHDDTPDRPLERVPGVGSEAGQTIVACVDTKACLTDQARADAADHGHPWGTPEEDATGHRARWER